VPRAARNSAAKRAVKEGELAETKQYYALCAEDEEGKTEVAFFELDEDALPGALGIAVYTAPDGELQRRHLQDENVVIAAKSFEELLDAMHTGVPNSVYVDGEPVAGSVFKARLKDALGIPLSRPHLLPPPLGPEERN
jgi:hypothetical protein